MLPLCLIVRVFVVINLCCMVFMLLSGVYTLNPAPNSPCTEILNPVAGTPLDQRRESPIVEMSLLLTEAVMHGLRTIAFCKSRKLCELIAAYTRENLKAAAPHKANMVKVGKAVHTIQVVHAHLRGLCIGS